MKEKFYLTFVILSIIVSYSFLTKVHENWHYYACKFYWISANIVYNSNTTEEVLRKYIEGDNKFVAWYVQYNTKDYNNLDKNKKIVILSMWLIFEIIYLLLLLVYIHLVIKEKTLLKYMSFTFIVLSIILTLYLNLLPSYSVDNWKIMPNDGMQIKSLFFNS